MQRSFCISAMSNENINPVTVSANKLFSSFKSPCQLVNVSKAFQKNQRPVHNGTPRPLVRKRKRVLANSFVSPLKNKIIKTELSEENIIKIEKEIQDQEKEIAQLEHEGLDVNDLNIYIDKLHEYNEIKDVGQMLIGHLALQKESTTSELYSKFGLSLED